MYALSQILNQAHISENLVKKSASRKGPSNVAEFAKNSDSPHGYGLEVYV